MIGATELRPAAPAPLARANPFHPLSRKFSVWAKSGGHCWYCGCGLDPSPALGNGMVEDHFVAAARGGSNDIDNLVPSCLRCNAMKGAWSIEQLRENHASRRDGRPRFSQVQREWLAAQGFVFPGHFQFWFEGVCA